MIVIFNPLIQTKVKTPVHLFFKSNVVQVFRLNVILLLYVKVAICVPKHLNVQSSDHNLMLLLLLYCS